MSLWVDVAEAAAVLNVAVLAGLVGVWARSYRRLGSKHALGLLVFGGFLLAENLLWVYAYSFDAGFHAWLYEGTPFTRQAMLGLCVLESVALLVLAWVTWD
ncbi:MULTISPECIES: hypothetical protein [Halorussus]|uniref:hypothetical protein n=1 Tax=Halorussus TaxID=1070314 RepID=UPI000E217C87|nr:MULTISPECIES: hypothetical protein [Halorussus]NHN59266.1 hypothetical protein [Halorussus sp. JP-T4]